MLFAIYNESTKIKIYVYFIMDEKKKSSKKGLKCYTKTTNAGKQYTTCNADAQKKKPASAPAVAKKKPRKKLVIVDKPKPASAPAVVKKKPRKKLVIVDKPKPAPAPAVVKKKPRKKLVIVDKPPPPPPTAKPPPPPPPPPARPFVAAKKTTYDDISSDVRKSIFEFSGNPKDIIEQKLVDATDIAKESRINMIDYELQAMFGKSLDQLGIKKKVPIYNPSMVRKMRMIGMRVGGSNDKEIYNILPEVQGQIGLDDYMRFLPRLDARFQRLYERRKVRKEKEKEAKKAEQAKKTKKNRERYDKFVEYFKDDLKGIGKGGVRKIFNFIPSYYYDGLLVGEGMDSIEYDDIMGAIKRFRETGSTKSRFRFDPGA